MFEAANAILMLILALNLFALGSSRIITIINLVATQGILLGILPLLVHEEITVASLIATAAASALKGILIPIIMLRALRDVQIKREIDPLIGTLPSIVLGAIATAIIFVLFHNIPLLTSIKANFILPASLATIVAGFLMLMTRFKAITQVLGYLILENGIFLFSLLLIKAIPLVVEMGMLLDLFVAVFVISIITNHINQAFSSLDTRNLSNLKEE